jgi:hypothetical protein
LFAALGPNLTREKGVIDMVKEQRRGNREAKKPKKDKSASTPAPTSAWVTVEKLKTQDRTKK